MVAAAALAGGAVGHRAAGAQRGSSALTATTVCGLRLPPPRGGEIAFRIPSGGRAVRRALAAGFALCTLRRRDGSRFAELQSDAQQRILGFAFYRRSGKLLHTADATPAASSSTGSDVKCDSSSQAALGGGFWRQTLNWRVGPTPSGIAKDTVVGAVRNAVSEWNNNINWCGIKDQANVPVHYDGTTSGSVKHDEKNVVDWGSVANDQDCAGAIACALSWYDEKGNPVESDIRFSTAVKWSASGGAGAYDIQTVAAHEFGHVFQLGHVTSESKRDYTTVMWPYVDMADTTGHKLGRGDATANNSHY